MAEVLADETGATAPPAADEAIGATEPATPGRREGAERPEAPDATHGPTGPMGVDAGPGEVVRYFGDYEIRGEIARGGMGVVYRARQLSLNRDVALKMIRSAHLAGEEEVRRFRAEAEAAANLDHPHIVPIFEVGRHEGQHYYCMKHIAGGSLARRLPEFRRDPRRAARLMATIARAVDHAHRRGILHRDLKPANILLDGRGEPHVTDLGLARPVDGGPGLTRSGALLGTPGYMAPEQAAGRARDLTTAVDVYALGVIFYELLTGRPPFEGESAMEVIRRSVEEEPARPRSLDPAVDRDLETIALTCLEKDPHRRYGTAEALAEDLERWLRGEPIRARPTSRRERLAKWARRRPAVAALAAAVTLVSLIGSVGIFWNWRAAVRNAARAEASRREALATADRMRRTAYAARLQLAGREWEDANVLRVASLLDATVPGPDEPDLRGFEWYYLDHLCRPTEHRHSCEDLLLSGLAYHPDGTRLAAVGKLPKDTGILVAWDLTTRRQAFTKSLGITGPDHGAGNPKVAFSPDGSLLGVTVGGDVETGPERPANTILLLDAETGEEHARLRATEGIISGFSFGPHGRRLVAAAGRQWTLWDVESAQVVATRLFPQDEHPPDCSPIAYGPGGSWIATVAFRERGRASVDLLDPNSGEITRRIPFDYGEGFPRLDAIATSPDGRRIAVGVGREVRIFDVERGEELKRLRGTGGVVKFLAYSPDGRSLASSDMGRVATTVWEANTGRSVDVVRGWGLGPPAFHPDGELLAIAARRLPPETGCQIRIYNVERGVESLTIARFDEDVPTALAAGPEGGTIFCGTGGGRLQAWDAESCRLIREVEPGRDREGLAVSEEGGHVGAIRDIAASQGGRRIATAGRDGTIRLWDSSTLGVIRVFTGLVRPDRDGGFTSVSIHPDGKRLAAVGSPPNVLVVWDVESGELLTRRDQPAYSVAYGPRGDVLAVRESRGVVLRDAETLGRIREFPARIPVIPETQALALSPDGSLVAATDATHGVRMWETATGVAVPLDGRGLQLVDLAFSPDGTRLFAADRHGTLRLWETGSGREVMTLRDQPESFHALAIGHDGRWLVTADGLRDRSLTLWVGRGH